MGTDLSSVYAAQVYRAAIAGSIHAVFVSFRQSTTPIVGPFAFASQNSHPTPQRLHEEDQMNLLKSFSLTVDWGGVHSPIGDGTGVRATITAIP